jgi:hypothetical protein
MTRTATITPSLLNPLHPQMRGLVGWWPMYEGAGLTAHDLTL